ncbi:hypothetical protein [Micromonospora sp. NPDC050200]|uniref:hypothetical protein n=1 Tax=Micromonospora sp. NPDC050200 TaxID=3155664 RepID=UPI003402B261
MARVSADAEARTNRLAGLTRIGIDELSYKRVGVTVSNSEERLAVELPFGD